MTIRLGGVAPPAACCKNQEICTKIRALKKLPFFVAQFWCRIKPSKSGGNMARRKNPEYKTAREEIAADLRPALDLRDAER